MKISENGINLIKKYEGCKLTAYKCPDGVWTIGYGHTGNVKQGQTITQEYADTLLKSDLVSYELKVSKYDTQYNWKQNEFDALVSFAYNIGNIDQLTDRGTRSRDEIAKKILLYNKAAGKVLTGLTKRREEERKMFLSAGSPATYPTLKKGSTGAIVKDMQKKLAEKGYTLVCDGIFGAKTLEAVKAFQAEERLVTDGIVGIKTWEKLKK